MTTDAVQDPGGQPESAGPESGRPAALDTGWFAQPVPVPLDPDVWQGPLWLRRPEWSSVASEPGAADDREVPPADASLPGDGPEPTVAESDLAEVPAVEPSGDAAPTAGAIVPVEAMALVPVAPPTAREVAETAIRAVLEIDKTIESLQAMRTHALAGIGHVAVDDVLAEKLDPAVGLRDVANEIGTLQRRSDRTVETELTEAMQQVERWPATLHAWGAARIHRGHVRVIEEIGAALKDPEERAAFEAALIPHAEQTTPGRLKAIARRELERYQTEPLAARHQEARKRRSLHVTDLDDGMSVMPILMPTVLAHGAYDRLTQMALALRRAGDQRTLDHLRADLAAELLLTGDPKGNSLDEVMLGAITASISVVIPATVLLSPDGGADDVEDAADGELDEGARRRRDVARLINGTPVDPVTAKLLASKAKHWVRLFTDPVRGQVLAVDTYQPSKRLKQLLRARDQHCRWPGCMLRNARCDIDHTIPWAEGGKTEHGNLAHFCRRHHVLKGAKLSGARAWKVEQRSPGVLVFTSPMGEVYIDEPPQAGPIFRDLPWGELDAAMDTDQLPF